MTANDNVLGNKEKITVTLPVSDTIPGPANYTVEILNMNGPGIPVINATDLIDSFGGGTAEDIGSTEQAPGTSGESYTNRVQEEHDEDEKRH